MDNPESILIALRDLVAAAEEAGWDTTENREVLDDGRQAYAALRDFFGADIHLDDIHADALVPL